MKPLILLMLFGLLSACTPPPAPPLPRDPNLDLFAETPPATPPVATSPVPTEAAGTPLISRNEVQAFIREMVKQHGFSNASLQATFRRVQTKPEIIKAMSRPAEAKPWYAYRQIFITPQRIQRGAQFWREHQAVLARAEQVYGVPSETVVAIIGVETSYGSLTGKYRVLEALATLAFDYPRRADYFRKELQNFLLLARDERIDPLSVKGSYAGAFGWGQFMPSSFRNYAVDFDGDGRRDIWNNPDDAIGSVANYLSQHRWQRGQPVAVPARVQGREFSGLISRRVTPPKWTIAALRQQGIEPRYAVGEQLNASLMEFQTDQGMEYWLGFDNFYVITRYNSSLLYAMAVYQLGQEVRHRYQRVADL